jgi:hypothetical protein
VKQAKPGEFLEIVANTCGHDFTIGDIVLVMPYKEWAEYELADKEEGVICRHIEGSDNWFVSHTDYVITVHPSSYENLKQQIEDLTQEKNDYQELLRILVEDIGVGKHVVSMESIKEIAKTELQKHGHHTTMRPYR